MIKFLREKNKLNEILFLAVISVFTLLLLVARFKYSGTYHFIFLVWNLFLAAIPWGITTTLIIFPFLQKKKIIVFSVLIVWLLFFPNSLYIFTDLFHLRNNWEMPLWLDFAMILSFAWSGMMYAFFSLIDVGFILSKYLKGFVRNILCSIVLFISAFGVYIGRFLRWNSWDILSDPVSIIYNVADRFVNPYSYPRTWGVTIILGVFFNIAFWSFKIISNKIDLNKS